MRSLHTCVIFFALAATSVAAHPIYWEDIPNGGKVQRLGIKWPAVGHMKSQSGGLNFNRFGQDFHKANHFWTRELCEMDSDGDGQTNGFELGDPHCKWSKASKLPPARSKEISHPGFADSVAFPPRATEKTEKRDSRRFMEQNNIGSFGGSTSLNHNGQSGNGRLSASSWNDFPRGESFARSSGTVNAPASRFGSKLDSTPSSPFLGSGDRSMNSYNEPSTRNSNFLQESSNLNYPSIGSGSQRDFSFSNADPSGGVNFPSMGPSSFGSTRDSMPSFPSFGGGQFSDSNYPTSERLPFGSDSVTMSRDDNRIGSFELPSGSAPSFDFSLPGDRNSVSTEGSNSPFSQNVGSTSFSRGIPGFSMGGSRFPSGSNLEPLTPGPSPRGEQMSGDDSEDDSKGGSPIKVSFRIKITFSRSVDELKSDEGVLKTEVGKILGLRGDDDLEILSVVPGSAIVTFRLETSIPTLSTDSEVLQKLRMEVSAGALSSFGVVADSIEVAQITSGENETSSKSSLSSNSPIQPTLSRGNESQLIGAPSAADASEGLTVMLAVIIAVIVLVALGILTVCCVLRRRKAREGTGQTSEENESDMKNVQKFEKYAVGSDETIPPPGQTTETTEGKTEESYGFSEV